MILIIGLAIALLLIGCSSDDNLSIEEPTHGLKVSLELPSELRKEVSSLTIEEGLTITEAEFRLYEAEDGEQVIEQEKLKDFDHPEGYGEIIFESIEARKDYRVEVDLIGYLEQDEEDTKVLYSGIEEVLDIVPGSLTELEVEIKPELAKSIEVIISNADDYEIQTITLSHMSRGIEVTKDYETGVIFNTGEELDGGELELLPARWWLIIEAKDEQAEMQTARSEVLLLPAQEREAEIEARFSAMLVSVEGVDNIEVELGTSEEDVIGKLAGTTTISDNFGQLYTVDLEWSIDDYNRDQAGDYTATGTFELPEGIENREPELDLEVEATVSVIDPEAEPIDIEGMVLVPAGTTAVDNGELTIEEDFYIGEYNVTQAEFEAVMGFNPSYFNDQDHPNLTGDTTNRPVEIITWYDAVMYANQLSEEEGLDKYYNISDIEYKGDDAVGIEHPQNIDSATVTENEGVNGYRLPTEDEHEYAARGAKDGNPTTYAGSDTLDEVGWYWDNSDAANSEETYPKNGSGTMPVGEKEANELGLYDMSGNVYDWTNTAVDSDKLRRGGAWNGSDNYDDEYPNYFEVSYSQTISPSNSVHGIGFRLVRQP